MLKQRGWAALLPIGLIAIVATGGTVMVAEKAVNAKEPTLAGALFKGEPAMRKGEVTYEMEGVKAPSQNTPGGTK